MKVRVGSRRSRLARIQAESVMEGLVKAHPEIEAVWVGVETEGDRRTEALPDIGGKGLFTQALEDALRAGELDVAVHSLKDMPTELPDGLTIAAVTRRVDAADVLVTHKADRLSALPAGSVVGTSSLRRAALLKELRPDVRSTSIRGNIDTRLEKLERGEVDALVVASAGLKRAGREGVITERLDPSLFVPAPGQGALALETAVGNDRVSALLSALHDEETARATHAERAFLEKVGTGCQMPLGAYAQRRGDELLLHVFFQPDEGAPFRGRGSGRDGADLAALLYEQLRAHSESA